MGKPKEIKLSDEDGDGTWTARIPVTISNACSYKVVKDGNKTKKVIASPEPGTSLRARSGRGNPHASKQGKYGLLRRRNFKFLLLAMTECLC